ncbi:hypothetical protein PGTUg99_026346 [Puccinia graminis f. sp. tritici]|uniref:Uncharacterized protein n=1 Tax=Puccinia graminis f. sp. tritici TaxID=56615 RepID=A0A5B0QSQ8_PUCGR|nr:hypothetical protein PGTUg99_026346 [Puccinia graminis f. sp. tritici]
MKIENIAAVEVFGWWWWLPVDRRLLSGKAVQAAGSVVIFSVTKVIDKPRSTRSHPSQANAPRVLILIRLSPPRLPEYCSSCPHIH